MSHAGGRPKKLTPAQVKYIYTLRNEWRMSWKLIRAVLERSNIYITVDTIRNNYISYVENTQGAVDMREDDNNYLKNSGGVWTLKLYKSLVPVRLVERAKFEAWWLINKV